MFLNIAWPAQPFGGFWNLHYMFINFDQSKKKQNHGTTSTKPFYSSGNCPVKQFRLSNLKHKTMKITILKISSIFLLLSLMGAGCVKKEEVTTDDYVLIEDVTAKVFKSLKRLDENNQPMDYDWAISTNKDYLDLSETPIDSNILAPLNLPDDFKISGLKIVVNGKKYVKRNQVLTSPNFKNGFGYAFELTSIKKLN